MIDQVCVDGILEVPTAEVWQEDVDGLLDPVVLRVAADGGSPTTPRVGRDSVVDRFNDIRVGEELVGFNFLHGALDGFLAEGTCILGGRVSSARFNQPDIRASPKREKGRPANRRTLTADFLKRI